MGKFKPVSSLVDFPALERELLDYWYQQGIIKKYLKRNDKSTKKFSFLDGPITANNPMGVHHGWGRTYKDLWQRFYNMRGFRQRFQNGFDEQGLWVEVEVEKELGLKSKKDIENLVEGDRFKSLVKFINLCKDRVKKYSSIQTEQSKRLGYFMDWDNSYRTSSDKNNYAIWNYLKTVHQKGWLYKGRDSVPWCPRCGTAISQHEILTEEYKEVEHDSVYFKLPIKERKHEYLVVWTTTPWTIPANVAVAVDPKKDYVKVKVGEEFIYLLKVRAKTLGFDKFETLSGKDLVGLTYEAPFDHLPRVSDALGEYVHRVIENDELILPISEEDGTGLVHIATSAGAEDFKMGLKLNLPVIEVIDEGGNYLNGLEEFSTQNAKNKPEIIIYFLKVRSQGEFLFKTEKIKHRYPTCWRCKTELVWRVVDEWYIAMDHPSRKASDGKQTYRKQLIEVAKRINWIPKWGMDRELDWLKNMHDWLISKKRYWGLALPIWECESCERFEVLGGVGELREKAVVGWSEFEGHSPHRPWIDQVKIKCFRCGQECLRISDVGSPWLDAGIVPFSTMPSDWFPADFITESFPGQFKNWFYSLIAMSTALTREAPFKNLLGFATMIDEKGEAFHKSKGNAIEFVEGADNAGADIIRWMCATQNPEQDLLFGYNNSAAVKRRFYLILWNSYKFFIDYANLAKWECNKTPNNINEKLTVLDRWILARLTGVVLLANESLEKYNAATPARAIEDFVVNDLSTWYIRRSRDRVGPCANTKDQIVFLSTIYGVLVTLSKLLAPFMPFISEAIYINLTGEESVHLSNFPTGEAKLLDKKLIEDMSLVRKLVEVGHHQRKEANIKLRQPLPQFTYYYPQNLSNELEQIMADELNVKKIEYKKSSAKDLNGALNITISSQLKAEGEVRELIRQIQSLRKEKGLTLNDAIEIKSPIIPKSKQTVELILKETNAKAITPAQVISIETVQ